MPDTTLATIFSEAMPCTDCVHVARCRRVAQLCCEAFGLYVAGSTRWPKAARVPSRAIFRRVFAKMPSIRAAMRERQAKVQRWRGTDAELVRLVKVSAVTLGKDRKAVGKPARFQAAMDARRAALMTWQGTDRELGERFGCTGATVGNDRRALNIPTRFLGGARPGGGAPRGPRKKKDAAGSHSRVGSIRHTTSCQLAPS